jgi:hypothetical protein
VLTWLEKLLGQIGSNIPNPVKTLIGWAAGGIGAIVQLVFGDVTGAWREFTEAAEALAHEVEEHAAAVVTALTRIITVDIPRYAMTAWWWVTNPHELADVLFWHVIYWLEQRADQAAQYLGEFALHLITRNTSAVLKLLETILDAVL